LFVRYTNQILLRSYLSKHKLGFLLLQLLLQEFLFMLGKV
jgi:hypothetical protein